VIDERRLADPALVVEEGDRLQTLPQTVTRK
jgi:hypothetical protein